MTPCADDRDVVVVLPEVRWWRRGFVWGWFSEEKDTHFYDEARIKERIEMAGELAKKGLL